MTNPDLARFTAWAAEALQHYPCEVTGVHFLGHSDNVTFRVDLADGGAALLRLHTPALAYWAGERQQPEVITGELLWMESLAQQGGFLLQRPIRATNGDLVALVAIDGAPIPATMLSWCEGVHFSPAPQGVVDPRAPQWIRQFGALVARMHAFSADWQPPADFSRPSYDPDHFRRIFARLLRGVDFDVFGEDDYRILRAAAQEILKEIDALPDNPAHWGMIHADLHMGNFLINPQQQIIPIDFSFCGFGHYALDVSICLSGGLKADLRPAFLEGYRSVRALPESSLRAVDAYALAGMFGYYAYQVDNPAERAWLARRIPEVARTTCTRFLNNQPVL